MVQYKCEAVKMANKESDPENENIPKDVQERPEAYEQRVRVTNKVRGDFHHSWTKKEPEENHVG